MLLLPLLLLPPRLQSPLLRLRLSLLLPPSLSLLLPQPPSLFPLHRKKATKTATTMSPSLLLRPRPRLLLSRPVEMTMTAAKTTSPRYDKAVRVGIMIHVDARHHSPRRPSRLLPRPVAAVKTMTSQSLLRMPPFV